MNKIKLLEIKKLFKELDYIESDYEYRNEIISEADSDFIKKVNIFLDDYPELKELYDKKITDKINSSIRSSVDIVIEDISEEVFEEEIIQDVKSPKIKKLYREIVKLTHPDKVDKKSLNDIYINSTKCYNENDKIGIYKICTYLDIDYDIDENDDKIIESKIESIKNRIAFLETTFTYQWIQMEDEVQKTEMMVNFIKMRIQ
jgi:hypothetical protein